MSFNSPAAETVRELIGLEFAFVGEAKIVTINETYDGEMSDRFDSLKAATHDADRWPN